MKIGDKVKVINGYYSGQTGNIIKIFPSMFGDKKALVVLKDRKIWLKMEDLENG